MQMEMIGLDGEEDNLILNIVNWQLCGAAGSRTPLRHLIVFNIQLAIIDIKIVWG
jgi:hypothetical protein